MPNPLSDNGRALLELLDGFRVATSTIITKTVCDGSESATKKLVVKLRDYVASDPLGPKSVYYRLTPQGAKLLGVPEEQARPLGPQALPKALGILGFCLEGIEKRVRYSRQSFLEDFPEFAREVVNKDYQTDFFLDFDGTHVRLGQIVVDQGGDYRKLISKCRVRLREYLDVAHLRDIVADGLFTVAIVVAQTEKARAIRAELETKPLKARCIVETSAELQRCPIQIGLSNDVF